MPLELRPAWCLADEAVEDVVTWGPWTTDDGPAADLDGDDWRPGDSLRLRRAVELRVDAIDLRRRLALRPGAVVGVAARWSCRATATAGVHTRGPSPLELFGDTELTLEVPATIAGSLEIETCLIINWPISNRPASSCPDGALVWSDGWTLPARERSVLLEGSEGRIPVETVSFTERFGAPSGALWAIDVDPSVELDDLLSNVVTVLLNREVLQREFRGAEGEADASLLPSSALAGMSVDLVRILTAELQEELAGEETQRDLADGTVGQMLVSRLTETFGSLDTALADLESDQPTFARELWNRFAPGSWRGR